MKIRLYNAKILTLDGSIDDNKMIEGGELHVQGSRISYVGEALQSQALASLQFDREIDCGGNLLMPGFKNAHAHGPMTFLRSKADDLPLDDWLHQQVFPAEAKLTGEDTYWLHKLAILEYVSGGITASFEMYFIDEGIRRAAKELGFRTVLCGAAVGEDMEWLQRLETDLQSRGRDADTEDDLLQFRLGFHAEYSTSRRLLECIADLANTYMVPVYTHCQETEKETLECIERYGKTPVQFLSELGMFAYGGGLFHGVWPMEGDIACMKQHKISVVTNPGSNAKLASGVAPLAEYMREGILLGIGTDGPASNNCLDMFWEMHLAAVLQKITLRSAEAMPAEQVLRMATVNGAHIMGLLDSDCLAVGKRADMIMIDLHQPNMQPENHPVKNLIYSGSKCNVAMTMVNGQILYDSEGFAAGIDAEEIYRRANEITARIHG